MPRSAWTSTKTKLARLGRRRLPFGPAHLHELAAVGPERLAGHGLGFANSAADVDVRDGALVAARDTVEDDARLDDLAEGPKGRAPHCRDRQLSIWHREPFLPPHNSVLCRAGALNPVTNSAVNRRAIAGPSSFCRDAAPSGSSTGWDDRPKMS